MSSLKSSNLPPISYGRHMSVPYVSPFVWRQPPSLDIALLIDTMVVSECVVVVIRVHSHQATATVTNVVRPSGESSRPSGESSCPSGKSTCPSPVKCPFEVSIRSSEVACGLADDTGALVGERICKQFADDVWYEGTLDDFVPGYKW
eukprot:5956881-Pyramimonas_sp.AAC.1